MNSFLRFFTFLTYFDLYGIGINLYIDRKLLVKSRIGGITSIIVVVIAFYSLSLNLASWQNIQNLKIISSSQSTTPAQLLQNNVTSSYIFDSKNFYVYFTVYATLGNGTMLEYYDLDRYVTQKIIYSDEHRVVSTIPFENCLRRKQFEFLQQPYTGDPNKIAKTIICLKDDIKMGHFPDHKEQFINNPVISYTVLKCQNSTDNNFSCASNEEIQKLMPSIKIQVSTPQTNYDFNDPYNPRNRTWNNQMYHPDYNLVKWFSAALGTVAIKTDHGIMTEEYVSDTIDFNVNNLQYETMVRNVEENEIFLQYDIKFGFNQLTYYRKNTKLTDIIGNFGGTFNLLMTIGQVLCTFYNVLLVRHKLINITFENESTSEIKKQMIKKDGEKRNFKFSILSLFCPKLIKENSYGSAMKYIYEYLDIRYIIARLQDIDKLKAVLLDKKQRKIFDSTPKLAIRGKSKLKKREALSIEDMAKSREKTIWRTKTQKYQFVFNEDPVNKRLLQMMDPEIKLLLQLNKNQPIVAEKNEKKENLNTISPMIPTLACTANKIYALETENLKVGIKMLKEEKVPEEDDVCDERP